MDEEQQSRWRPTRRQLLWAGIIIGVVALLLLIRLGYAYRWTGFSQYKVNGEVQPFKTLWDWLALLIIPLVLAVGGYLFTRSENRATQSAAERRAQDEALQAYLDQMGQLLLGKDQPLRQSEEDSEVRTLARARTLTLLAGLTGDRKWSVLMFLHESGLISTKDGPVVSLVWANLQDAKLGEMVLEGAALRGTKLQRANLYKANLSGADLYEADLTDANLTGAEVVTKEQLAQCKSLKGATMPDGQKYEDWLKSEGRGEDGENSGPS